MHRNVLKLLLLLSKRAFQIFLIQVFAMNFLLAKSTHGQRLNKVKVTLQMDQASLEDIFYEIEKLTKFKFAYAENVISSTTRLDVNYNRQRLSDVLEQIATKTDLNFRRINNTISVQEKKYRLELNAPITSLNRTKAITVRGKVTDENGNGLPGVNIIVKGTVIGVVSDIDGNYVLDVPDNAETLSFSFIGYATQEVTIGSQTVIDVTLKADITSLSEVVVLGYGSVQKRDLTGSVSTIKSKQLDDLTPIINIDQALQGQAAGVYVQQGSGQPGSAARVRIRGATSLLGSNQPLYVIDGIPVVAESNIPDDNTGLNRDALQEGINSPLGNINPNDIASVSVLKDASAAALYGSRAANGVIIITTKRGSNTGAPQFNVSFTSTIQDAPTQDVLNAQQYREILTESVQNGVINDAFTRSVLDSSYFDTGDTNWEDELSPSNPISTNFDFFWLYGFIKL